VIEAYRNQAVSDLRLRLEDEYFVT